MLNQTTVCNVNLQSFEKFDDSASSLVRKIFIFENWCLLRVANVDLVALSLSHVYRGWWASVSAQCCCRGWASFSVHFWTSGTYFFVMMLIQQQSEPLVEEWNVLTTVRTIGRRTKSAVQCKPVFLRIDGCCCKSVHVPTSFCCCKLQPVVLGDEK